MKRYFTEENGQKKLKKKNSFDLTGTHRNANTQEEIQTQLPE